MPQHRNERILRARKYRLWVRTNKPPYRAVKWDPKIKENGNQSYLGDRWVEVLGVDDDREPERYFAADVELAPTSEYMLYEPAEDEPVCGWRYNSLAFCPQPALPPDEDGKRRFCKRHEEELAQQGEEKTA